MAHDLSEFSDADLGAGMGEWDACETVAEHRTLLWYACEQPERPIDDHAMFAVNPRDLSGCPGCARAWRVLRLPAKGLRPVPR